MMVVAVIQVRLYTPRRRISTPTVQQRLRRLARKEQIRRRARRDRSITRRFPPRIHSRPSLSAPWATTDRRRSVRGGRRTTRPRPSDPSPRGHRSRSPAARPGTTVRCPPTTQWRRRGLVVARQLQYLSTGNRQALEQTCPDRWQRERKRLNNSARSYNELHSSNRQFLIMSMMMWWGPSTTINRLHSLAVSIIIITDFCHVCQLCSNLKS